MRLLIGDANISFIIHSLLRAEHLVISDSVSAVVTVLIARITLFMLINIGFMLIGSCTSTITIGQWHGRKATLLSRETTVCGYRDFSGSPKLPSLPQSQSPCRLLSTHVAHRNAKIRGVLFARSVPAIKRALSPRGDAVKS